ncbi:predicted protein [Botrytis cinerea T4]|uniref:Uncharacterized protein n=1 Tax=Botryotinia fuckeliana (strain T4) TaxID=999810 RepID=G2Y2K4_BOTF4|nr:predicted protein [Botrytis cinerea T4]
MVALKPVLETGIYPVILDPTGPRSILQLCSPPRTLSPELPPNSNAPSKGRPHFFRQRARHELNCTANDTAYPVGTCAEKAAFGKAVVQGDKISPVLHILRIKSNC